MRAGDPVSIADFKTKTIARDKDAATYLRCIEKDAESLQTQLTSVAGDLRDRTDQLDDAELNAIESAFAAYPDVIPFIEQAASCTDVSMDFGKNGAKAKDLLRLE